jgi:molybdopterin molybdotransferase
VIPVGEARARILAGLSPLASEPVGLDDALGRVLAEDVAATLTQPPKAMSAMDGYAVRSADVASIPADLKLTGESSAGGAYDGTVAVGEAVRIFTGAPLPAGADTVVIQENVEPEGTAVRVLEPATTGKNVRAAGLDFQKGDVRLRAGRRLTSRDVGLAAAMNVPELAVRRRPHVAILATGDELVPPGTPPGPNQIVSSNGASLAAVIAGAGGVPVDLGIARDDPVSLRRMSQGAESADFFVTIGGASAGDYDLIQKVLGESGLELDFWKVAIRPGKPLIAGALKGVPMLGLPGNPVSALVCALVFLRPALEALQGVDVPSDGRVAAVLGRDLAENDLREDYLRSELGRDKGGALVATPFAKQDSSHLSALAAADCLAIRRPHAPAAKAGDPIEIISFTLGVDGY